jgi:hypothetical protein
MPDNGQHAQCEFIKPDGERCRGRARPSGLCPFHDPSVEAQRRRGQSRGGRRAHRGAAFVPRGTPHWELRTPAQVREALATLVNMTVRGQLDTKAGNCATYMLATLLRSIEGDELAKRIEQLEQLAERQQRRNGHPKGGRL